MEEQHNAWKRSYDMARWKKIRRRVDLYFMFMISYVKGKKDGYGTYTRQNLLIFIISRKDGKKYIGEWKNGK